MINNGEKNYSFDLLLGKFIDQFIYFFIEFFFKLSILATFRNSVNSDFYEYYLKYLFVKIFLFFCI